MKQLLKSFWADESGQGLVEYALIIALVAIGLFVALTFLRDEIGDLFTLIGTKLQGAPGADYVAPTG